MATAWPRPENPDDFLRGIFYPTDFVSDPLPFGQTTDLFTFPDISHAPGTLYEIVAYGVSVTRTGVLTGPQQVSARTIFQFTDAIGVQRTFFRSRTFTFTAAGLATQTADIISCFAAVGKMREDIQPFGYNPDAPSSQVQFRLNTMAATEGNYSVSCNLFGIRAIGDPKSIFVVFNGT